MARLLKGAATRHLTRHGQYPLSEEHNGSRARLWAESHWKVFLDSEQQIETAIRYVEENPGKEGLPAQKWTFVTGFRGLEPGQVFYH